MLQINRFIFDLDFLLFALSVCVFSNIHRQRVTCSFLHFIWTVWTVCCETKCGYTSLWLAADE